MRPNELIELALGRILRIASRPYRDGDLQEYERCRAIILDAAEAEGTTATSSSLGHCRPGWNFGNKVLE